MCLNFEAVHWWNHDRIFYLQNLTSECAKIPGLHTCLQYFLEPRFLQNVYKIYIELYFIKPEPQSLSIQDILYFPLPNRKLLLTTYFKVLIWWETTWLFTLVCRGTCLIYTTIYSMQSESADYIFMQLASVVEL